jgi:hypothetical protein
LVKIRIAIVLSPIKKYLSYVIGRAAKVHTERPELPVADLPETLLASGELSDEILITLALGGKNIVRGAFSRFRPGFLPANTSQSFKKSIS